MIEDYPHVRRLADVLYHRGIQALLLLKGCEFPSDPDFPWDHFVSVATGLHHGSDPVDTVRYDAFQTVLMVWNQVYQAGWRRIGAYLPYDSLPLDLAEEKRLAAVEYCLRRSLPPEQVVPPLQCGFQEPERFRAWLEAHRSEALISVTLEPLMDKRFLPANAAPLPLASLQLNEFNLRPGKFAGSAVFGETMQAQAIDWLDEKLRLGRFGLSQPGRHMSIEPEWVSGDSLWKATEPRGRALA